MHNRCDWRVGHVTYFWGGAQRRRGQRGMGGHGLASAANGLSWNRKLAQMGTVRFELTKTDTSGELQSPAINQAMRRPQHVPSRQAALRHVSDLRWTAKAASPQAASKPPSRWTPFPRVRSIRQRAAGALDSRHVGRTVLVAPPRPTRAGTIDIHPLVAKADRRDGRPGFSRAGARQLR